MWETFKDIYFDNDVSLEYLHWSNYSNSASATLAEDVAEGWGKAWMDSLMTPYAGNLLRRYALNRDISRRHGTGRHININDNGFFNVSPAHNDYINFSLNYGYSFRDRYEDVFEHYLLDYPKDPSQPPLKGEESSPFKGELERVSERGDGLYNRYRPNIDKSLPAEQDGGMGEHRAASSRHVAFDRGNAADARCRQQPALAQQDH